SIIGRPRPLPSDRRAHPGYTLICEEPTKPTIGRPPLVLTEPKCPACPASAASRSECDLSTARR
ncbi:hypothetical protein EUA98_19555, partial [Pengzhenrongella frigida]